jgi:hypothetical protein
LKLAQKTASNIGKMSPDGRIFPTFFLHFYVFERERLENQELKVGCGGWI